MGSYRMKKNWYALITKARCEKKVSEAFAQLGIVHYLPLQKQLRIWKDRKKWLEMPLFSTYIFVYCTEVERNKVFSVAHVLKYVQIKGIASILKDDEIERIKLLCLYPEEVQLAPTQFYAGQEVEVLSGPLLGLVGKIVERSNNSYLNIKIEGLGQVASLKIDKRIVKLVNK